MNDVLGALIQAGIVVFLAFVSYLAQKATAYLKKEGILTELESKKEIAKIVVSATEQIFKESDGPAKLERAKATLIDELNKKKIPFTQEELNTLIESTVNALKQGINNGVAE